MCELVTIMTGVAMGASMYGSYKQSKAQEQQGRFAQAQANANANLAEMAAADAVARGGEEASRYRGQVDRLISQQRVALAASGVDASSGSAAQLVADTRAIGELDERTIINNAAREAWGLKTQATQMREQGRLSALAGEQMAQATLIGGWADAGGRYGPKVHAGLKKP